MGAAHEHDGERTVSPRVRSRPRRDQPEGDDMLSERQVPLAATIGVLGRFALKRYQESCLYTGEKSD
jgi:hypothetical protein